MYHGGQEAAEGHSGPGDVCRWKDLFCWGGDWAGAKAEEELWGHEDRLRMEQGALRRPPEGQLGACMEGTLSIRQGDTGGERGLGLNNV